MPPIAKPRTTVGILAFDDVQALDVFGPLETFASARVDGEPVYDARIVALADRKFKTESGVTLVADSTTSEAFAYDTVLVPGGRGLRDPAILPLAAAWLLSQAATSRRVVSVCTGAYGLAEAGLLDGRRATVHWRFAADLARRYPAVDVSPDALFIKDGSLFTSAGITAGIDLSLALIEEDHGPGVALACAREMVVFLKRPGGQNQYSEPLAMQIESRDRFADLVAWMSANLQADQSVEALAARSGLSLRHFGRRFRASFGVSPGQFVEDVRLAQARTRLEASEESISTIAVRVGFSSDDAFARVFERRLGVRPSEYRQRFQTSGSVVPAPADIITRTRKH
ncbi:GlxA family transcriptional regulator [Brevundimonas sp. R86498]|uniref:GlxA family transcriptional regulator n=1 Tax=Brevundimonas sp. R86498 TaxID=3093845 RepID=UPI0037CA326B